MSIEIETRNGASRPRPGRRPRTDDGGEPAATPAPPPMPGRRNPKWIALGVVAICLGGLLSYVVYARLASEVPAVAVAETVYRGATITRSDLTTVGVIPSRGLSYVPADQIGSLVGKKAALDLGKGSVVSPEALRDVKLPADTRSLVGVKLAGGRAPVGLLFPGSNVRLVALPAADSGPGADDPYRGKAYSAIVVDQQPDADGTGILVNVDVPTGLAQDVSVLAAQDRLALVRDADR